MKFIFSRKGCKFELGKKIRNLFYNDKNLSLMITLINGVYLFNDFGNTEYQGDVFDFASTNYQLDARYDFYKILERINDDLCLRLESGMPIANQEKLILFKDFSREELSYWNEYGINERLLNKYEIKSVEWFKLMKTDIPKRIDNRGKLKFDYPLYLA